MSRNNYRVVSVEKHSATITDETTWQGELCTFQISRHGIEAAEIGDSVSADQTPNPNVMANGFLEKGKNAAALKPLSFIPPKVEPFNPNAVGEQQVFRTERGQPLSPDDIDQMLREQQKQIASLVARVSLIEFRQPKHCSVCSAHLASGAFDR
jgi:hypothetical protein